MTLRIPCRNGQGALPVVRKEKQFENLDKSDILAYRRQDYQIDVLVNNKEAAERKYAGIVIDHATIDEIMLILVKGEQK